ncbi:MAG: S9 family peptidase [Solirubrobacterales bacterium]
MSPFAPFGSWRSPISAADVARAGRRLGAAAIAADGAVWWTEGRPEEGGRVVLMRRPAGGEPETVTPEGHCVRTRVHEYGGGAWRLAGPDQVVFAELSDQRLYRQRLGEEAVAITPEPASPGVLRYADLRLDPDEITVYCVREVHREGEGEPENQIVSLPLDGAAEPTVIASGRDFYSFPRPSPDGRWLAWTCWDHPNMPWEGTELWLADLEDPSGSALLAGGPTESIFQPEWDREGRLHYVSDRDGWWNLYRVADGTGEQLTAERADLGHPQWLFGGATYALLDHGGVVCVRTERGAERLYRLGAGAWEPRDLGLPFTDFGFPALAARGTRVAFAAAGPRQETAVCLLDTADGSVQTVRAASDAPLDPAYVSEPRAIEFPSGEGATAYAYYYPPANPEFEAPPGELPPLLVESHGGPTSHAAPALNRERAYWTSRGFGVVDVNYRGSSGHGRAYRELLRGSWGVADSEDCVAAARHLAATGEVDGARIAIHGGSAGGYATLCALVFHDELATGASYYGVADAEALARDTHKFEARYLDSLIGPYPQRADLYRERSPIHHVDRLRVPVILFQGLEDEVVPPTQAETMAAALERNGVPYAYLAFAGEQHGFRRAETRIRCLEAELYFYGRILGFEPAGRPEPVEIVGLVDPGQAPS